MPIYRFTSGDKKGGKAATYSTHVLPRLAGVGREIVLGWVEAIDGGPEVAYYVARSKDGGRSFTEPVKTHGGAAGRPGFTTLVAGPDGSVLAAWLDGRNGGQQPFAATCPSGSPAFQPEHLIYAGPDGKGICPCCDLAMVRATDGQEIVAFRNTDAGHRDIWIARSRSDGPPGFEVPVSVGASPWTFDGCPHDGPALAIDGERLHVLWMDAHTGKGRIYAASSPRVSWNFTMAAVRPETAGAQGHPKAVVRDHRLIAAWDEAIDDGSLEAGQPVNENEGREHGHHASLAGTGRAVMLSVSSDSGASFPTPGLSPLAAASISSTLRWPSRRTGPSCWPGTSSIPGASGSSSRVSSRPPVVFSPRSRPPMSENDESPRPAGSAGRRRSGR